MDLIELQENLQNLFGEDAKIVLDNECIRRYEIEKFGEEFLPHVFLVYRCAKVKLRDGTHRMVPIKPHREQMLYKDFLENMPLKKSVYINPKDLKELHNYNGQQDRDMYDLKMQSLKEICWNSEKEIDALMRKNHE